MGESGEVRYLGKSSGFYLLQNSRTYQNGAFHFTGRNQPSTSQARSITNSSFNPLELPPKDLSEHLVKLYFRHIYPVLPLFYKRRLVSSTGTVFEMMSPLLLNAIYAVASRMSPDVRVRSDPTSADTAGDVFFERARCLLDDYYDMPKISTIQALLLLAAHQHGAMKPARAWLYSGMAFRMAQDLGLHRNCDHWDIPAEERERRKRVFWCCYILDRILSASYGRSATFEERDCDVPLPNIDDDDEYEHEHEFNPDSENVQPPIRIMVAFTNLISLCHIMGDVLKNIYYAKSLVHTSINHVEHILTSLNQELTKWHDNLPFSIRFDPSNPHTPATPEFLSPIVGQLHMMYYTTVILLHRPFIPGQKQAANIVSLPSNEICLSAANSILSIVNIMLEKDYLRYTLHYTIYCIFTAAIIFIQTASSPEKEKALEAKINITKILRALDEIETTWITASRTSGILAELVGLREINLDRRHSSERSQTLPVNVPDQEGVDNHNNISYEDTMDVPTTSIASQSSSYEEPRSWNNTDTRSSAKTDDDLRNISYDNSHFGGSNYAPSYMGQPPVSEDKRGSLQSPSSWSDHSSINHSSQFAMTPLTDPFAAPNTVLNRPLNRQFNPFGSAFWGVPSSLDMNEWNTYLGNQGTQPYSHQLQPEIHRSQHQQPNYGSTNNVDSFLNSHYTDSTPLISSRSLSSINSFKGPATQINMPQIQNMAGRSNMSSYFPLQKNVSYNDTKDLIHSDSVDVLSGANMPLNMSNSPSGSSLLGLMSNPAESTMASDIGPK
ncbi:fungal-specific transcription factor domain-containing protein [Phycomyces nitens]|nr:fungal-specific transcription factor domain-containing protein [Phycomyces nitens]